MIKFKIRNRVDGVDVLQEVIAEEYDENVYYVSSRTNKDFRYNYSFYDKKTGLMVCYGKTKKELFDTYNNLFVRYTKIQNDKIYKQYIEQYEQLKKRWTTYKGGECMSDKLKLKNYICTKKEEYTRELLRNQSLTPLEKELYSRLLEVIDDIQNICIERNRY